MGLHKVEEAINTRINVDPELEECLELIHSLPKAKRRMAMHLIRTLTKDEETKQDKLVQLRVIK